MALPSAEEMIVQLERFYSPSTPQGERENLDKCLQDIRRAPGAWELLDQLLTRSNNEAVQSFSATAMKWRMKNEKPKPELGSQLQQAILGHIVRLRGGKKNILETLCLAIIELLKQQPNPDMVGKLCRELSSPDTCDVLLLFLDVLGEEAGLILEDLLSAQGDEDRLKMLNDQLRADQALISHEHPLLVTVLPNTELVLNMLHTIWPSAQTAPPRRAQLLFVVFSRWLRFGLCGSKHSVAPEHVVSSPIAQAAITSLGNPAVSADAAEVVVELAVLTGENLDTWTPVVSFLSSNLLNINTMLQASRDDPDQAELLTRVICKIGRAFSALLAEANPDAIAMVDILVQASSHPDKNVFGHTIGFWNRFEYMMGMMYSSPLYEQKVEALSKSLKNLVHVLLTQAMYPTDADRWGEEDDEQADFITFRERDLSQPIYSVSAILTPLVAMQTAFPQFSASIQQPNKWRETEAVLYFLTQLHQSKGLKSELLPQLLSHSAAIAGCHWRVQETYLVVIGEDAGWLHESGKELLPPLVGFVARSMEHPRLVDAAIDSLRKLCRCCQKEMVHLFPSLQARLGYWQNLKTGPAKQLMKALGSLSTELPPDQLVGAIHALCEPCVTKIQTPETPGSCVLEFQKLQALYQGVDTSRAKVEDKRDRRRGASASQFPPEILQAWSNAFGIMWPTVHRAMQRFYQKEDVMEAICGFIRQALYTSQLHFASHLESLVHALLDVFEQKAQSSVLWVMASVVSTFGESEQFVQPIMQVMTVFVEKTVALLGSVPNVGPYSDFIQELFYVVRMALFRFPDQLLASPMAVAVFEIALAALVNTDVTREAAWDGVLNFILELTNNDVSKEVHDVAMHFLRGKQPRLVEAMLHAVIKRDLDSSDRIGNILMNLRDVTPHDDFFQWVYRGLSVIPGDVPPEARQRCFEEMKAATVCDQMHKLLEKLHREAPSNWR